MKSQWMERNGLRSIFSAIFVVSVFVLFGCSVIGQIVPFEKRIPLVMDGIQKGEQITNHVKMTYTYRLYQRKPDLRGLLEIEGNAQWESGVAYKMWVWLDFLDNEGKILERETLMDNYNETGGSFQEKLEAPAGTVGISFEASAARFSPPPVPLAPLPPLTRTPSDI